MWIFDFLIYEPDPLQITVSQVGDTELFVFPLKGQTYNQ